MKKKREKKNTYLEPKRRVCVWAPFCHHCPPFSQLKSPFPLGNKEVVVVQSDNPSLRVGEPGYLACRTTNTAANIEDTHAGTQDHLRSEVMFMTSQGSKESLSFVETREVKGL